MRQDSLWHEGRGLLPPLAGSIPALPARPRQDALRCCVGVAVPRPQKGTHHMDPDIVLLACREAASALIASADEDAAGFAAAFGSLDQWLLSGDFLPGAWSR
jgi:hypothetical protein